MPMLGMAVHPIWLNWNKCIAIKYDYLATMVAVKNAAVVQNIQWQKFPTDTKVGYSFTKKLKLEFIPYGLALEFWGKKEKN